MSKIEATPQDVIIRVAEMVGDAGVQSLAGACDNFQAHGQEGCTTSVETIIEGLRVKVCVQIAIADARESNE